MRASVSIKGDLATELIRRHADQFCRFRAGAIQVSEERVREVCRAERLATRVVSGELWVIGRLPRDSRRWTGKR